jgi:imidazoleglycerol-phosphate dehydratase
MRSAEISRTTRETDIRLRMNLDEPGEGQIRLGIGFLEHMLVLFARHSGIYLDIQAQGDLHVDPHHLIEDVGICLGLALDKALGDKRGIERYGYAYVPMDETLVRAVVDLSGRPFLVYSCPSKTSMVGEFPVEMMEEFWRALTMNGRLNLHLVCLYGLNQHHIFEAAFKAAARALRQAIHLTPASDLIPSTKGIL